TTGGSTTTTGGSTTTTGGSTAGGSTTTSGGSTGGMPPDMAVHAGSPDLSAIAADGGSTGPDPNLVPADGSGQPCAAPGATYTECPSAQVCRFFTSSQGRCESGGGGHLRDSCTSSADCDTLFACYAGYCENFCPLGTMECGHVSDCVDVGFAA